MLEPIRRLGLAANREVRAAREVVLEAMGVAAAAGVEVLLDAEQGAWLGLEAHGRELRDFAADCDLVLVFGGDGTFLRAARALERASTPLLGINMGSLGFLTLLKLEDMATALAAILGGAYRLEERMRLTATVIRDGAARNDYLALNDAVVHMSDGNRLVEFRIAVSGQHLGGYRADGLIVATPTGSTAYSLSAGGPIVHPTMDALVATPICPHALSIRPILVGGEEELRVSIGGRSGPAILTLDGADSIPLQSGDQIRIHRAEARALRIALPLDFDYYGLVSEKLGWGVPDGR
ncbi:MAG: NAD(+)/NADH kinase [Candidatus Krumholzibacteriia bacterium]|nr:NAD(+)/NADH kinase [bacterium]MCB9515106.1 NAD(+)/NADH kinase [Candidatus Latescibacterota bacterium]